MKVANNNNDNMMRADEWRGGTFDSMIRFQMRSLKMVRMLNIGHDLKLILKPTTISKSNNVGISKSQNLTFSLMCFVEHTKFINKR